MRRAPSSFLLCGLDFAQRLWRGSNAAEAASRQQDNVVSSAAIDGTSHVASRRSAIENEPLSLVASAKTRSAKTCPTIVAVKGEKEKKRARAIKKGSGFARSSEITRECE